MGILLTRDQFREGVFARDGKKCVHCDAPGVDAHHIVERRLFVDGGYYLNNGVTLCADCHLAAEATVLDCYQLRIDAAIPEVVLPDHLFVDGNYDKWGNSIMDNGQRMCGELFDEEPVQKMLRPVIHLFTNRIKYPRTYHFPWSPGLQNDDRMLPSTAGWEGTEVVITEKMDGECLSALTRIAMADGTETTIREIVEGKLVGNCVFGQDEEGNVVPSRILRVYNNGRTKDWRKVKIKGAHGPYHSIYCTPDEQFFVVGAGYRSVDSMTPSTEVLLIEPSFNLTERQSQILLGKLLGDGSFHVGKGRNKKPDHNRRHASVQWSHKNSHADYTKWVKNELGAIGSGISPVYKSGFGSSMLKGWTVENRAVYEKFCSFKESVKKTVPYWVIGALTPLSLAVWYMDDGSLGHSRKQKDRAQFSTCGFTADDCDVLIEALSKLGIKANKHFYDYWYINVNAQNSEKLFQLIAPFVVPCMQYKLPSKFRELFTALLPDEKPQLKGWTRKVKVVAVEKTNKRRIPVQMRSNVKYDLETETHNFFANGVLVHNCTTLYKGDLHARSLEFSPHASRTFIKAIHAAVEFDIPENYRICGENMTAVHSIRYENLPSYFLCFNIWDRLTCLSWEETMEWTALLNLQTVPLIYWGQYSDGLCEELCKQLVPDKQEGLVVRPARAFQLKEFPYVVGKYVRAKHVTTDQHWMKKEVEFNGLDTAN